ncbi:MAG: MazG nucleotide pyrophosphohydrolase domain-containing protein, partial [Pseudomonadota bacterium]
EIGELKEAAASGDEAHIEEELGDLLFVCANLARRMKIDPEQALRKANAKFERRFRAMEVIASEDNGPKFKERSLEDQEALWQAVKRAEKG